MLDRGLWVAFEGADGVGKSATMAMVGQTLKAALPDLEIIQTTHPGSTPLGKHLRQLVRNPQSINDSIEIDPLSEQLLMVVDHTNFVRTILEPALARGAIVLADRCNLISGLVYGMAAGLNATQLNSIFHLAGQRRVDTIYIMRCGHSIRRQRLRERHARSHTDLDRFERRRGVVEIYDNLLTGPPERTVLVNRIAALDNIKYIDSTPTLTHVAAELCADIRKLITSNST
jgi:dTMP kinase